MKLIEFLRGKTVLAAIGFIVVVVLQYFGFDVQVSDIPAFETLMDIFKWVLGLMGFYGIGQSQVDREEFYYGKQTMEKRRF